MAFLFDNVKIFRFQLTTMDYSPIMVGFLRLQKKHLSKVSHPKVNKKRSLMGLELHSIFEGEVMF